MEETESFTEHLEEDLYEVAEHAKTNWLKLSALMSAILAVLATIAGLESGSASNDAMLLQIESANQWNYYQAKGIKAAIAELKPDTQAQERADKYRKEQESIREKANAFAEESRKQLHKHETLARAVAMFQVAIAITAIAVMTRRKGFLLFSLALGMVGAGFLFLGIV